MEVKWIILIVIAIISAFLFGYLIGTKRNRKYDGTLFIGTVEDRDQFRFIFSTELEDLQKQTELVMKIEHSQNPQPL